MNKLAFRSALVSQAPEYGLELSEGVVEQFCEHYELLVTWNRKVNLTRITDPVEAARHHFLEAAFLSRILDTAPARIVDVGSGAGFPGIPLACMFPRTPTVLVEPLVKRVVFLKEVVRKLELERVEVRNTVFSSDIVDADTLLVARALDGFRALLPSLITSPAGVVALFSEPDLLESARLLAPDRSSRVAELPGSDRRKVGLFARSFHVERD